MKELISQKFEEEGQDGWGAGGGGRGRGEKKKEKRNNSMQ